MTILICFAANQIKVSDAVDYDIVLNKKECFPFVLMILLTPGSGHILNGSPLLTQRDAIYHSFIHFMT